MIMESDKMDFTYPDSQPDRKSNGADAAVSEGAHFSDADAGQSTAVCRR